jgi:hypothetical protein
MWMNSSQPTDELSLIGERAEQSFHLIDRLLQSVPVDALIHAQSQGWPQPNGAIDIISCDEWSCGCICCDQQMNWVQMGRVQSNHTI